MQLNLRTFSELQVITFFQIHGPARHISDSNAQMKGLEALFSSPHRFTFNGKESDTEVKGEGNQQDYGFRVYDPRIAKFLSVDPLTKEYPWYTPYQFAGNSPIESIDIDGLEKGSTSNPNRKDDGGVPANKTIEQQYEELSILEKMVFMLYSALNELGEELNKQDGTSENNILKSTEHITNTVLLFEAHKEMTKVTRSPSASSQSSKIRPKVVIPNSNLVKQLANTAVRLGGREIIIDENLSPSLASGLKKEGFLVKIFPKGTSDADIIKYAKNNNAVVMTNNIKHYKNKGITTFEVPERLKPKNKSDELIGKIIKIDESTKANNMLMNPGSNVKVNTH